MLGVDLATLEAVFLVAMGGWLIVLGGAFLLSQRTVDRVSAVLLALAGVYAILWQEPAMLGMGEALHTAIAQPVFLLLVSGAIFLWIYWLFERHVEQLETARDELGQALTLERTLFDVFSHDLRNPLATAILDLEALARRQPDLADELEPIEEEIERASDVMANGLAYTRLSGHEEDVEVGPLDLVTVVDQAVDHCRRRADAADVELEVQTPDQLSIAGSPLLERAIENVLDNAIKFSPAGGRVLVSVEDGSDRAIVSVVDQGPGVPDEEQGGMFERFSQGDPRDRGAGLGLAIVDQVVELHDGRIEVTDAPGGGTAVRLTFPKQGPPRAQPTPGASPQKASVATPREEVT